MRATLVCMYINGRGSGIIFNRMLIYKQQVTIKVWLNNNVLGLTNLVKHEEKLVCCVLS